MKKSLIVLPSFLFALLITIFFTPGFASAQANNEGDYTHLTEIPTGYTGIYSPSDLDHIRDDLSGKYILMNDINLSEAVAVGGDSYHEGAGWNPIGTENQPFSGVLDGNGYKVIGLKINISTENNVFAGLIGYATNAEVKNLGMTNGEIKVQNTSIDSSTGQVNAGGIIGYGYNISISNSYNENPVEAYSSISSYAGGIVGSITSSSTAPSTITSSNNSAGIKGKSATGGLAGKVYYTNITKSFNNGDINQGNQYGQNSGGIAGTISNSSIDESYNTGKISYATDYKSGGGIVGSASASTLNNISNRGNVSGSNFSGQVGGIAGSISGNTKIFNANNSGSIENSFYTGGIAGSASNSMTVQSYNSGEISGRESGGIYGYSSTSHIKDSFNLGKITGSYYSGGIVGYGIDSTIQTTYNAGRIICGSRTMGYYGQISGPFSGGTITNSYFWSYNNYGDTSGTRITDLEKMKQQASFEGFDFTSVWTMDKPTTSYPFPTLQGQDFFGGTGHDVAINMKSSPDKTVYAKNEPIDLTGAVITVATNWGNEKDINMTQDMIYSDETKYTGNHWVSVYYEGLYTSFPITVKNAYTVTFKDNAGTILKTEKVLEGDSATAPEIPEKEGYTFTGWDQDFSNIKANVTVTAQYTPHIYTVIFQTYDGTTIETKTVPYGQAVEPPEVPNRIGYTFDGWDHLLHFVTSDMIVKPQYSTAYYHVIFKDYNGKELDNYYVAYGSAASAPNLPVRTGYTFTGWNQNFSSVTSDLTITAQYKINTYTIIFKNGSSTLKTVKAIYNTKLATYNPAKSEYTFIGWYHDTGLTKKFSYNEPITKNSTLYAKLVKNTSVPTSIKVSSAGYTKINVSWTKVSDAAGYEIYRADLQSGAYSKITTITSGSTISYSNSGLSTGKTYYYKIRAYRIVDGIRVYSSFTKVVSTKPVLAVPAKVTLAKASGTSIKVSWSKVSEASGYEVYIATSRSGHYSKVKTIIRNSTLSYTNKSLKRGKTYYLKIRAYRIVNGTKKYSSYSTIKSLKL